MSDYIYCKTFPEDYLKIGAYTNVIELEIHTSEVEPVTIDLSSNKVDELIDILTNLKEEIKDD